jgi:hypothetical protein
MQHGACQQARARTNLDVVLDHDERPDLYV